VFVAMPLCNFVFLNHNMLTSLDVFVLSQQSQNVIEKVKQAWSINDSYLDIFESQKEYGYNYLFSENLIKRFNVNFEVILNDVFIRHKKNFLTRFIAISVIGQQKISCDCNTYLAFTFLVEQINEVYSSQNGALASDLPSFSCYKKESNESLYLFSMIDENQAKGGDFCAGESSEYKWTAYDLNITSVSTLVFCQIRCFSLFFVEIIILKIFL
jgi:hypothetical protein